MQVVEPAGHVVQHLLDVGLTHASAATRHKLWANMGFPDQQQQCPQHQASAVVCGGPMPAPVCHLLDCLHYLQQQHVQIMMR